MALPLVENIDYFRCRHHSWVSLVVVIETEAYHVLLSAELLVARISMLQ